MNWAGISFTRARVLEVGGILLLLLLGAVLAYITLGYIDPSSEPVTSTVRVWGAGDLLGGLDPTYLPGYTPDRRSQLDLALNLAAAGPGLQQIGTVVAAVACWGLFADEINKFFWWALHLAAYPLILSAVPALLGRQRLAAEGIDVALGPAWVAAVLAGALILVVTVRSRRRIDSYGGI